MSFDEREHSVFVPMRPNPPEGLRSLRRVCLFDAPQLATNPRQLRAGRPLRDLEQDMLVGSRRNGGDLPDLIERELSGTEGIGDRLQNPKSLSYPQELGAGVHIEAGIDGQPVGEGTDSARAPAADRIELRTRPRNLRQRRVGMRRNLADLTFQRRRQALILLAHRWEFHTRNCTKRMFAHQAFCMAFSQLGTENEKEPGYFGPTPHAPNFLT
jgi:hypothetical protein